MVVVAAVPGAGKTALLEWTAGAAASLGVEVLHASGYESSLPFAALDRLVAPLPEAAKAIRGPDTGSAPAAIDASVTGGLARLLVETLGARARRRPLALLVDDVQDLGQASRSVLDDTLAGLDDAGARHGVHLFVMLTTRYPMASGGLAERVARLGTARTLSLPGFDDREIFEFLAAEGLSPRPPEVRRLLEDTDGLPLLIESEVQRWRGPDQRGLRARRHADDARVRSISDALRLRFDQVDEPTRQVLERAAVLGEPWRSEELAAVIERPGDEIDAMTEAAEAARLVARSGPEIRFAHPLVRSALLDRLTVEQRRHLHRLMARRLREINQAKGTLDEDAMVRVADHLLRGGSEVPPHEVAETALQAGRIATSWAAHDQASRFLAASATAAVGLHPAGELARRFLEAGRAAYYDYDADLAESLFAHAISHAREASDDTVRLAAAMFLVRMRGARRRRPWDRVDVSELQAALHDDLEVEVAARLEAEAALAESLIGPGDGETAIGILESTRRLAATEEPSRSIEGALGRIDFTQGIHPMTQLDLDAAEALFASGLRHSVAAGNALDENLARSRAAFVGLMRGRIRSSHAELVAVERGTVAEGFWGEAGLAAALMAFSDALQGRPEAVETVEQAYRQWRRTGNPWNAAILSAVIPALSARMATRGDGPRDPSSAWSQPSDLPAPSVMTALAAVEAYDVASVRAILETARWRHGFSGPVTLNNIPVPAALVEVGDLIGDPSMVRSGLPALEEMHERGVVVTLPWPASVARLLAIGARHSGALRLARTYAESAREFAEREGLAPEYPKCLLELAQIASASGGDGQSEAESSMQRAVQAFDEQLLHGWVARCDALARQLGLPPTVGSYGVTRERTVFTNDVVGSTASNVRLGDLLYVEQLRVHDRLLRARLKEFRGVEIKHTGDGLVAVFDSPSDAAACAVAAVADFRAWKADEPELALQIRCGLAHGPLVPSGGDFFGLVQAEAARLCDLGGPGEVMASARVAESGMRGVEAHSLGRRLLRGMPSAEEVFRLSGP